MAKRMRIRSPARDQRIFRQTAAKTKVVNLPATVYRGGRRF